MASTLYRTYEQLMSYGDPRIKGWAIFDSPMVMITITVLYIYFVYVGGPQFMKDRKAFNIKTIILTYNFFNILLSAFFSYQYAVRTYFGGGYNWLCQAVDYTSPESGALLNLTWYYLLLRISDLLDTVFFILTKKDSHVTQLHVSHHVMVIWTVWLVGRFANGGVNISACSINSFVHVVMYTYYFLSLLGPSVRPYLWWKKYLTQLQLLQFTILFLHSMMSAVSDCGFPKFFSYLCMAETLYFLYNFFIFYKSSYNKSKRKSSLKASTDDHISMKEANGHTS